MRLPKYVDLTCLSECKLRKLLARLTDMDMKATDLAISVGWGDLRMSEIMDLAVNGNETALRIVKVWNYVNAALMEKQRRLEYHGTLKPIKRGELQ